MAQSTGEPRGNPRRPKPWSREEQLRKAEAYVEAEEGAVNRLIGWAGTLVTSVAVAMSLFHLYAAVAGAWPFTDFPIIATQPLRYAHVAFVLMLSFLLFPLAARFRNRIRWWDVVAGIAGGRHPGLRDRGRRGFHRPRHRSPTQLDIVLGVIFIVLLLEATRRTTGWIVPVVALAVHRLCASSGRICRRPGPIAASISGSSSAICSSRSKAFSAFRSTCRPR